jgi:hypothetical protein
MSTKQALALLPKVRETGKLYRKEPKKIGKTQKKIQGLGWREEARYLPECKCAGLGISELAKPHNLEKVAEAEREVIFIHVVKSKSTQQRVQRIAVCGRRGGEAYT